MADRHRDALSHVLHVSLLALMATSVVEPHVAAWGQTVYPQRTPSPQQQGRHAEHAPFRLTPQQQRDVDQVLLRWEAESEKIKTFTCTFDRLEYDPVFMKGGDTTAVTVSKGQVRYARPDKGLFRITQVQRFDPKTGTYKPSDEPDEHWVCDGKAVYEFNTVKRQLIVRPLPPEYQGKAIADGPLPYLFNAKAAKLKQRYFIRISEVTDQRIKLEVFPRWQQDAANYRKIDLLLDRSRFLPFAVQVFLPNQKNRVVYVFHIDGAKVNDPIERLLGVFKPPRAPLGWKRVVEQPSAPSPQQAARPDQPSAAAPRR